MPQIGRITNYSVETLYFLFIANDFVETSLILIHIHFNKMVLDSSGTNVCCLFPVMFSLSCQEGIISHLQN